MSQSKSAEYKKLYVGDWTVFHGLRHYSEVLDRNYYNNIDEVESKYGKIVYTIYGIVGQRFFYTDRDEVLSEVHRRGVKDTEIEHGGFYEKQVRHAVRVARKKGF